MTPPRGCHVGSGASRPPSASTNTRIPPIPPVSPTSPAVRTSKYAQTVMLDCPLVANMPSAGELTLQGCHHRMGGPNTGRRLVNPCQEGRCLRCLVQDHTIMTCQKPMKCRLCLQGGHRQASCPMKMPTSSPPANMGCYACLVGEIWVAEPAWSHIFDGLREMSPDLEDPEYHRLICGDAFLRGLTKEVWRLLYQ